MRASRGCPRGGESRGSARRPFHFQCERHVSTASRLNFGRSTASPLPAFGAASGCAGLLAGPTAARRFHAAGRPALAGGRGCPGSAVGVMPPSASRERAGSCPAARSPRPPRSVRGQRRSRAKRWQRCAG